MKPFILMTAGAIFLIVFLVLRDKKSSVPAIIFKTATSLCFVATALAALSGRNDEPTRELVLTAGLIVLGLVMGLVGDIFLDLKPYFKGYSAVCADSAKNHDNVTYFGMTAFGLGHILYAAALLIRFPDALGALLRLLLISIAVTAAIMCVSVFVMKMRFGRFIIPAVFYSILLALFTVLTAFILFSEKEGGAAAMLFTGSLLFLISDLILSITYFSKSEDYEREGVMNPESRFMIVLNHVTYYAAQFMIALSIARL